MPGVTKLVERSYCGGSRPAVLNIDQVLLAGQPEYATALEEYTPTC